MEIKATSDSPTNIEVALAPESDSQSGETSFIVKSVSRKTGVFYSFNRIGVR
jgi:hypothetical protein